jgi:Holliday junction resolvasome RuvABC DNA-binding subunit
VIGYIEGKILRIEEDRALVLANQVGYEILLPTIVIETVAVSVAPLASVTS